MVPLFETLDDLHNAPATMTTLFSSGWYLECINGVQVGGGARSKKHAYTWESFEACEAGGELEVCVGRVGAWNAPAALRRGPCLRLQAGSFR